MMATNHADQHSVNAETADRTTKFIHLPESYKVIQCEGGESGELDAAKSSQTGTQHAEPSHNDLIAIEGIAAAIPILVQAKQDTELKLLLNDPKNEKALKNCCWEVLPGLCTLIHAEQNTMVLHLCDITLSKLVELGNPKELLLELLSQTDAFIDEVKLNALLTPLQQCLLKLPKKRGHSLALTLESLYAHVERMDLPDHGDVCKLEGKEFILLHSTEDMIRLIDMCEVMMNFVEPFVNNLIPKICDEKIRVEHDKEVFEIIVFLLKLLSKPLVHLDLNVYNREIDESKNGSEIATPFYYSDLRTAAERAIKLISSLHVDHIALLNRVHLHNFRISRQKAKTKKKHSDNLRNIEPDELEDIMAEDEISELGIACLAYLTFGENVGMHDYPQIYLPTYHFQMNLKHVKTLISSTEMFIQQKGTLLMLSLLRNIDSASLLPISIDDGSLMPVIDIIVGVVINSQCKELQQSTLRVFPALLRAFVLKGRMRLLSYLINSYQHPGFSGYVIGLLKDQIHLCLQSDQLEFTSKQLSPLFLKVFDKQRVETDLLEHCDTIVGALNLLRYLIVRDSKEQNATGIWHMMITIQEQYLDVLRRSLDLSRAHYQLDLNKMLADPYADESTSLTFNVGSDVVPMPNRAEKIQVLNNALNRFDLIDSLLGRVNDLVAQHK